MAVNAVSHVLRCIGISRRGITIATYTSCASSPYSPRPLAPPLAPPPSLDSSFPPLSAIKDSPLGVLVPTHALSCPRPALSPQLYPLPLNHDLRLVGPLSGRTQDLNDPKLSPTHKLAPLSSINLDFPFPRPPSGIKDAPLWPFAPIEDLPLSRISPIHENTPTSPLDLPTPIIIEKQAARLIVIRRRKMKKHRRRKLAKRMKFFWRKRTQKKKLLKERAFEAELLAQMAEADAFNAKSYVESRLKILDHVRIPSKWRGQVLPETMIREFMREKEWKRTRLSRRPKLNLD